MVTLLLKRLGFALAAATLCAAPASAQEKLKVIATIPDLGSLAQTIGGDLVEVEVLVKPGSNPHSVLAKPSMLLKIQRADVLLEMGLSYEHAFLPAVLQKCRNEQVMPGGKGFCNCSAGVQPLQVPTSIDRGQGADVHPQGNPHFNLDPHNGRLMARNVYVTLAKMLPTHKAEFEARWKAWDARALKKMEEWQKLLEPHRGAKIVTYHRSWNYFAERFGLVIVGEVEPKPGLPPSAGHLHRLSQTMQQEKVRVLLIEPWYPEGNVASLIDATGAKLVKAPVTCGLTPETKGYLDYIDWVVRQIAVAMGES